MGPAVNEDGIAQAGHLMERAEVAGHGLAPHVLMLGSPGPQGPVA
jgi:hypothetical protein